MKLIFENKYANLFLDEENRLFKMVWLEETRNIKNEEFKDLMLEYSKYFTKDTVGVLHNMLHNHYILNEEMQLWVDNTINAKALHLGLRKVAFLITINLFAQVSVEETMKGNIGKQLNIEYFDNEQEAWDWLCADSK